MCRPQLDWSSRQLEMMVTKPRIWWMLGQCVERENLSKDFDKDDCIEVLEGVSFDFVSTTHLQRISLAKI